MSPLQPIAEQLAGLIAADGPERAALAELLGGQLRRLLAEPPGPDDLRSHFGDPFGPGQPLTAWCRDHLAAANLVSALSPLPAIATLLDYLAEDEPPLVLFHPDWFRVDDQGRVLVFPPQLALGLAQPGRAVLTAYQQQTLAAWLHPGLLRDFGQCDARATLLASLALFLARVFVNLQADDYEAMLAQLPVCRRCQPLLPPDLPALLLNVLARPADQQPEFTCRDLIVRIREAVRDNPLTCSTELSRAVRHELFAYSVFGLCKPVAVNEDRVLCWQHGQLSLLLAADGVSQVDLGTGEMAAEEIVRLFRNRFHARFVALADNLDANPEAVWSRDAELLLRDFFQQANAQVAAVANQLRDPQRPQLAHTPLCSTLTAALVMCDQALVAWVGDSPGLLFRRASGRLIPLTIADRVGLHEDFDAASGIDPNLLTHAIGEVHFDAKHGLYLAEQHEVPIVRVQMRPGDLLLAASDGLVDCIDEPTPAERFHRLESELRRMHLVDMPLRQLVRALVRLGEYGLSDDNISVAVARIHGAVVVDECLENGGH